MSERRGFLARPFSTSYGTYDYYRMLVWSESRPANNTTPPYNSVLGSFTSFSRGNGNYSFEAMMDRDGASVGLQLFGSGYSGFGKFSNRDLYLVEDSQ